MYLIPSHIFRRLNLVAGVAEDLALFQLGQPPILAPVPDAVRNLLPWVYVVDLKVVATSAPDTGFPQEVGGTSFFALSPLVLVAGLS